MNIDDLVSEKKLLAIAKKGLTDERNLRNKRGRLPGESGLLSVISTKEFDEKQIDEIGNKMPRFIDGNVAYKMWPDYWQHLKLEIYYVICTDSEQYRDVRKLLLKQSKKSETAIVSAIAAAVAVHLGIVAGALVPFCALALAGVLQIGKNAYCSAKAREAAKIETSLKRQKAKDPKMAEEREQWLSKRQERFKVEVKKLERKKRRSAK
ncbi:hypothetical protein [Bradyrhizobium sp. Ash2021]|uniref:hypothetical protein n=1 Tax=Bradyrhizobium sp. Ash2021 TaxID=2954771 RepID=UPI0028162F89|nr:hypothetical protein [Bradyrhizobium sp. Ash2021]WMT71621.1 hypothetical protein NL528_26425 [Bradyrhizobium sp. Ash2021]